MNKLFIISIVVLGLLIISGCGIEPGKSLAGQAGNRGGGSVVLSDSGKECKPFRFMEPDGITISGPFVCTEYQEKGLEKGTPWCATKVTSPGAFYVSGPKYGTEWDYCTKAFEAGKVSDVSVVVPPGGSRGGKIGPKADSGGEIVQGNDFTPEKIDGGRNPGVSGEGLVPDDGISGGDQTGDEKKNPTILSESTCLTKSKPVKVGLWKGNSVCVDRLAEVGVFIYGDIASLEENSDLSIAEHICLGLVRGVPIVMNPVTKETAVIKWKNPNIFMAGWAGACIGAVAKKGGPATIEEVDSSCLINPSFYESFFKKECDDYQWLLGCDKETQFGCDCTGNKDCESSYCVQRDTTRPWLGTMCTKTCTTNCPTNVNSKGQWMKCVQTGIGADYVSICSGLASN